MAEPTFDPRAFEARLETRVFGRRLIARASVESTNDVAWAEHAAGARHGTAVTADAQTRGRGRAGRTWHTVPGRGLAFSLLLCEQCADRPLHLLPLVAGLALAEGLARLGVDAALKWPNDVLVGGRKVAGVLAERRGSAVAPVAVVGAGVNVSQRAEDFPASLAAGTGGPAATSLALEGHALTREAVAATYLNALEPLWDDLGARGGAPVIEAWRRRAAFWGVTVRVRTPAGMVEGTAMTLDGDGRLVLETPGGGRVVVLAGDVELDTPGGVEAR